MRLIIASCILTVFIACSASAERLLQPAGPAYSPIINAGLHSIVYRTRLRLQPPQDGQGIRLAIFQNWDHVGTKAAMQYNFDQMVIAIKKAKAFHAQIIAFPELYLTGYALSPKVGRQLAETKDGFYIKKAEQVAKKNDIAIVLPYAEKAKNARGKFLYYDSIAFINNQGKLLESYRKTHLFGIAERLNWSAGNGPYKVFKVNGFPIGILNCYEAEFPELSRILALKGAKLIIIPTAADHFWKREDGSWTQVRYPDISKLLIPAFSYINHNFIAYANHAGYEKAGKDFWHFQGNSTIGDPHGRIFLAAQLDQTTLLIADIMPKYYGPTHPENANYLRDRRPRLYDELTKTKAKFNGGHVYPPYPKGEYAYPGFPAKKK